MKQLIKFTLLALTGMALNLEFGTVPPKRFHLEIFIPLLYAMTAPFALCVKSFTDMH